MHGHWSGNTRKFNKHYQSGDTRFDGYADFTYSNYVRMAMDRKKGLYVCISNCDYRKDTFVYVDDYVPICILPESVMHFGSIDVTTLELANSGFNAGQIKTRVNVQNIDVYDELGEKISKNCLVISVHKDHFTERAADYSGINLKNNIKQPFDSTNYFAIQFFGLGYIEDEESNWNILYKDVQSNGAINVGPDAFVSVGDAPYVQGVGPINIPAKSSYLYARIIHIGGNSIDIPLHTGSYPSFIYREDPVSYSYVSRLVSPYFETQYRTGQSNGGLDNRCFELNGIFLQSTKAKKLTNYKESW